MKVLLYTSFKLTGTRIFPTCPRPSYGLNSQRPEIIQVPNQVEIAKLTLASYKNLRPDYLYLNIDLGKYDSEEIRQEFCEVVRKSFPHAEAIELKWSRPIKVEKWLEQAKKIYQEFGNEIIVLANWNHDHPYIEESNALTDVLKESASTVLNGFDSSKTIYNITHQPSLLSILSEHFSVENRLGNEVNEIKTENGTLFVWPDMDHQAQGLFMCKPKYLYRCGQRYCHLITQSQNMFRDQISHKFQFLCTRRYLLLDA